MLKCSNISHLNLSVKIKEFYEQFPTDQILVLLFEEYVKEPSKDLNRICEFLGVDSTFDFDTSIQKNKASLPRNEGLNRLLVSTGIIKAAKSVVPRNLRSKATGLLYSDKNLPTMTVEESNWLRDYYGREVDELEILLNKNLGALWPEFKSKL